MADQIFADIEEKITDFIKELKEELLAIDKRYYELMNL